MTADTMDDDSDDRYYGHVVAEHGTTGPSRTAQVGLALLLLVAIGAGVTLGWVWGVIV